MTRLVKIAKMPINKKFLFTETFIWLGLARLILLVLPFKQVAPWLGKHQIATNNYNSAQKEIIDKMAYFIRNASPHTPWESKCLVQAMAARWMLQRRGIGGTLYLGVTKEEGENMKAHAWFKCGDLFVTGRKGHRQYTVVSCFG